ncbi:hypothetical protein MNBD_NITROSPINAE03-2039 [hydrothermal vent metagenome]|uniref:Uncharacterized protein n=1 Tax=hydrothermal vent metagenome TaxID=652676 RepID=A0A3B1C2X6_9ZZZZ
MPIQGYTPNRSLIQISSGSTDNWDTWYNQTLDLLDEPSIRYKITAAENLSLGDVAAIIDDGYGAKKAYLAASATYTFGDPIGISTETVTAGNPVHLTLAGRAQNNGWSFGASDKTVYLSASGTVTTTVVSAKLGYVISSTAIYFRPEDFSSTGGQTNSVTGASGVTNTGDNVNATLAPTYGSSASTICQGNDARLHSQNTDQATNSSSFEIDYTGNSARLLTTGLTANRDFTFPDATTKLLGEAAPATVTGDHDYSGGTLRAPNSVGAPSAANDKGDISFDTTNNDLYLGQGASSWKKIGGGGHSQNTDTGTSGATFEIGAGTSGAMTFSLGTRAASGTITFPDGSADMMARDKAATVIADHDYSGGTLRAPNNVGIPSGANDKGDIVFDTANDDLYLGQGASSWKKIGGGGGGSSAGFGAYSKLAIKPNATNPLYQVDVDADSITLSTGAAVYDAVSVNLTADITVSGVNGLDTGSEAISTWYAVWVIYNGTTVASLLSVSATAPTMPSGYTYKRLVGFVRNDAPGNFIDFVQRDKRVYYIAPVDIASGLAQTAYTAQDVSSVFPTASGWVAFMQVGGYGVGGDTDIALSINGGTNAQAKFRMSISGSVAGHFDEGYSRTSSTPGFMSWVSGNNVYFTMGNATAKTYTMQGLAFDLNL